MLKKQKQRYIGVYTRNRELPNMIQAEKWSKVHDLLTESEATDTAAILVTLKEDADGQEAMVLAQATHSSHEASAMLRSIHNMIRDADELDEAERLIVQAEEEEGDE